MQLLEDVGILGKGVMIMSGHDDEFHPNNIPPSPALTTSTQGAIPSVPMTPNSIGEGGEDVLKSRSSTPASPPASPSVPAKRTSIRSPLATAPGFTLPTAFAESKPFAFASDDFEPFAHASADFAPSAYDANHEPLVSKTPRPSANPAMDAILGAPIVAPNSIGRHHPSPPLRKHSRFGSPGSTVHGHGSILHITTIQDAHTAVAESKYRETLSLLEVCNSP